jgi:hypothetical protein
MKRTAALVIATTALATAAPHREGTGAIKATEDGGHDGPVTRSLLRDLLGEIRKTSNEQAAEIKELRKELTKTKRELDETKEELAEVNTNHGLNALARELNKTKVDMSKHYPQWSDYHALARVMNSTKDQLADLPDADDFVELRRDVVSRVHNLTREYFVGMPRQADVHMLKRELNKTKEMLEDMREDSADWNDLKEMRGDLLSRVHNITREYLLTQPHQSDIHALRRELNTTRLMLGELGTDLDERPTHADLAKMKREVWNTTKDFIEKDYLSVNKALLSMNAQHVSGPKFTGLKQPPHYSEIDDSSRKTPRLSKKRVTDGWHGWFPALQDEKPYRKAIALDSEPFPSVSASYFDLVRDPKTGEITFWTKEDDTEGTPWRQVDKIRLGLEASTVGNKTTTNAQFNGYVAPPSKELDAASDEAARLQ